MSAIVVIPARVKDARLLGGKPLVLHTLEVAVALNYGPILVNTASPEVRLCCEKFPDVFCPVRDPKAPGLRAGADVLANAIDALRLYIENVDETPDEVLILPPSVPFRDLETLRSFLEWFHDLRCDGAETGTVPVCRINQLVTLRDSGDYDAVEITDPSAVVELTNFAIVVKSAALLERGQHRIQVYLMPNEASREIRSEADWRAAEGCLTNQESRISVAI